MTVQQQLLYDNGYVTWKEKTRLVEGTEEVTGDSIHLTLEGNTYFFYVQYTTVNGVKYNNSAELIAALS
jgi:hypothetical protein